MDGVLRFEQISADGAARHGRVTTARGSFETPVFMPVGTRGAVVHLDATDYTSLGADVVLANTYHLMQRPGPDIVEELGGLHEFTGWSGHMLTDSGGYQVMSLKPKIDDDGVTFKSTYDGSSARLTPESATQIQARLGADIAMVLDICPALPSKPHEVRAAMDTTHRWAERARDTHNHSTQAQFGIVQGGIDPELRAESAKILADLDFPGYGIGGLSVGETRVEMLPALTSAVGQLPTTKPRYLMGVGDPMSMIEAVAVGVDMFDCVLPTRLARHGTVLTKQGRVNLKNAAYARDRDPLEADMAVSNKWSKGYLRHLLNVKEPTAARILTLHNVAFLFRLMQRAKEAIDAGCLDELKAEVAAYWS